MREQYILKRIMSHQNTPELSIAVPLYNEAASLEQFHTRLVTVLRTATIDTYEIIYCNDGSTDATRAIATDIAKADSNVIFLSLSRNFGKENALAAAIRHTSGKAVILIDGDGQHPIDKIPEFIAAWKKGAQVVIGERGHTDGETRSKKFFSRIFYRLFNAVTGQHLDPYATDYRLLDRAVVDAYLELPETDRINRGLIDWLGFDRAYIPIKREKRIAGHATYSFGKLTRLAVNSFVSLSSKPLYTLCYIGFFITIAAFLLGATVFVEQLILHDPLLWRFTGSAMLGILIIFFIGIVLVSQGIASIYIATIYNQVKQRPLFVVDTKNSVGLKDRNGAPS